MYFDRAQIKETAKTILKRGYWTVVLVVAIVGLLGGVVAGGATDGINLNLGDTTRNNYDDTIPEMGADMQTPDGGLYSPWEEDFETENPWAENGVGEDAYDFSWDAFWAEWFGENNDGMTTLFLTVFTVVLLVVLVLAMAWQTFLGNVMTVGGHGWLLRYWRGETPSVGDAFDGFKIYGKAVGTMFVKDLYVFLWSLLFVIPGIVKGYAYSMVPYIIGENPRLSANQAIKISEKMTDGYKGELFVFYLSYFGWHLLSGLTGGLVGLFYVNPYIGVAHAGVYEDLKWKAIQSGQLTWEDFGQVPPSDVPPYGYDPATGRPAAPNGSPSQPASGYPTQPNGTVPPAQES